jgi:hypothetical protein
MKNYKEHIWKMYAQAGLDVKTTQYIKQTI